MDIYEFRKGSLLGSGVYGKIYKAENESDGKTYAIKVNMGYTRIDGMISLTDLSFSRCINGHPCFVQMEWLPRIPFKEKLERIDNPYTKIPLRYDNLVFIMEIAETTLSNFITKDRIEELAPNARKFLAQILLGLEFIHAHGISHRDIKPNNILIYYDENGKPHAKIADYGFAHFIGKERNTVEVQGVLYRAPEIAARCPHYNNRIDIWSLGISFYEMLTVGAIPYPGKDFDKVNEYKILERIHQAFSLDNVSYPAVATNFLQGITRVKSARTFETRFKKNLHPLFDKYYSYEHYFDLLSNMLNVDYEKRFSATQCLNHSFFTEDPSTLEMINEYRSRFNVKSNGTVSSQRNRVIVSDSPVRQMMFKYADDVKNVAYENYSWFTYQIWFASIDLFDRWLVWALENETKELNDEDIFVAYYTCLYMMLKTCSSRRKHDFVSLHHGLCDYKEQFRVLEKKIVKLTDGYIFRPTIFDELPDFDPAKDFILLREVIYEKIYKFNGRRWITVTEAYLNAKEKYLRNNALRADAQE